jgi:hypothetical protein
LGCDHLRELGRRPLILRRRFDQRFRDAEAALALCVRSNLSQPFGDRYCGEAISFGFRGRYLRFFDGNLLRRLRISRRSPPRLFFCALPQSALLAKLRVALPRPIE